MATVMPPAMLEALKPEAVSPAVAYLASEACEETGRVIVCGAGHFAAAQMVESDGVNIAQADLSPESFQAHLAKILDMTDAKHYKDATNAGGKVFSAL